MRLKLFLYSFLLSAAFVGVAMLGILFGEPWNLYFTLGSTVAYCAGVCWLMVHFGALKRGAHGWLWMRFMFGLMALAGLYALGFTIVVVVWMSPVHP